MILPKGNSLIEKASLTGADINVMLNNLEQDGFCGRVQIQTSDYEGDIFFLHGSAVNSIEIAGKSASISSASRILSKLKGAQAEVSNYVFSPQILSVISSAFAFNLIYENYYVKKNELMNIIKEIEQDNLTGFLEAPLKEGTFYLAFEEGKIVIDNFIGGFGQVICGVEETKKFLDYLSREGANIYLYGEKADIVEMRRVQAKKELDKVKQLFVKAEGRFLKSQGEVRIDENIYKLWQASPGPIDIEIETQTGKVYKLRCVPGKKLEEYVVFGKNFLKNLNLNEGDMVRVAPARRGE